MTARGGNRANKETKMTEKVEIAAFYYDVGDTVCSRDKECRSIFEAAGGKLYYREYTYGGRSSGEREIGYYVPNDRADECRAALSQAGFRLESAPRETAVA
jgi:hypothetical protein